MRICIQMLYTESWKEIALITVPNVVNYCRKHGYSWNIKCIPEPYDAFEKIREIKKIFYANEADVVMSMDCDAMVTDYTKRVEDFISEHNSFFCCEDYNGLNTGIFIVKNDIEGNIIIDYSLPMQGDIGFNCEQDKISNYFYHNTESDTGIEILSHPSINSYLYENYSEIPLQTHEQGQWNQGDFILHLPAIGMDKRKEILNEYKNRIIYE